MGFKIFKTSLTPKKNFWHQKTQKERKILIFIHFFGDLDIRPKMIVKRNAYTQIRILWTISL